MQQLRSEGGRTDRSKDAAERRVREPRFTCLDAMTRGGEPTVGAIDDDLVHET